MYQIPLQSIKWRHRITVSNVQILVLTSFFLFNVPCYGLTLLNNQDLPDKRIWLFAEPHGMASYNTTKPYGSLYLLTLKEKSTDTARYAMGQLLLDAGITGYIIGTTAGEPFNGWKSVMAADFSTNYPAIKLTICVASGTVDNIVYSVKSYINAVRHYSCAPKIDNKFVIFTYAPNGTSLIDWQNVRTQLNDSGYSTFFFQDVKSNPTTGKPDSTLITGLLPAFDGCYKWTDANYRNTDDWSNWNWLVAFMNANGNRVWAGGMMPAYSRESPNGGFMEYPQGGYKGTYHLRAMLQGHLDSHLQWWHISTANDCSEETQLLPSSWWHRSRADITRLYAYRLGSMTSKPTTSAHLYAVSPQQVHLGDSLYAEALIVNWSESTKKAQIELYDGNYSFITSSAIASVTADSTGAATFNGYSINELPPKRFFRLKALMYTADGTLITSVWSAPVCVYTATQSTALRKSNFFVIPAHKALQGIVSVSLSGNPATGNAAITVTPPVETTVRFAEVMQNLKLVFNDNGQGQFIQKHPEPYTVSLPTQSYTVNGGEIVNPERVGFYTACIIDNEERIGYSDPVYADSEAVISARQRQTLLVQEKHRDISSIIKIYNLRGALLSRRHFQEKPEVGNELKHVPYGIYIVAHTAGGTRAPSFRVYVNK